MICLSSAQLACQSHPVNADFNVSWLEKELCAQSKSYTFNYRIKYLFKDDTFQRQSTLISIKDEIDTIFGRAFWSIDSSGIEYFYYRGKVHKVIHDSKKIIEFSHESSFPDALSGACLDFGVIECDYFKKLSSYNDPRITRKCDDDFCKLEIKYEDRLPISGQTKTYYFNLRHNNSLSKVTHIVNYQDYQQYTEWNFIQAQSHKYSCNDIKKRIEDLKSQYYVVQNHQGDTVEYRNISNKNFIDSLNGWYFSDSTLFKLSDQESDIIVVYFWYMSCYPCIQSIPHLNTLRRKYSSSDLAIVGVNGVDINRNRSSIEKFIRSQKIQYAIVFIPESLIRYYSISAYPSLVIMKNNGTVIHTSVGFSERNISKVDSIISHNLPD